MEKREITLAEIVRIIVRHWYIIVAAMVAGLLIALYLHNTLIRPRYASQTVYYVNAHRYVETDNADLIDSQRIISFSRMIVGNHIDLLDTLDYTETLSGILKEHYADKLTKQYTPTELYRAISYKYDDENAEKQAYTVTVTVGDPKDAWIIAGAIQDSASSYASAIDEALGGTLKIADHARYSEAPVNNRLAAFLLLGVLLGFVISFGVLFIVDLNDVRVKDERDLTKVFDMPVLGTIPEYTKTTNGVHGRA